MKSRSANRSLLVVGSVALDDIDGPFGFHKNLLGGSASFFSTAASYFTDRVSVIGVVGHDFPERHVEMLRGRGVDVSGIERQDGETFHWVGKYSDDLSSRESLDTRLGVFAEFKPRLSERQRDVDLLFLGNIHPALQLDVLDQASEPGMVAADTMNFWIEGNPEELARTLARVDTLLINDEEARLLAGEHNLVRAAAKIRAMGPKTLVVKRGDAGALLFDEEGTFFTPGLPLDDVRDVTGAGDTFAGGFMGYLAFVGDTSPAAIRYAMVAGSIMASFSVQQFSLDGLLNLTTEMIEERAEAFRKLTFYEPIKL